MTTRITPRIIIGSLFVAASMGPALADGWSPKFSDEKVEQYVEKNWGYTDVEVDVRGRTIHGTGVNADGDTVSGRYVPGTNKVIINDGTGKPKMIDLGDINVFIKN